MTAERATFSLADIGLSKVCVVNLVVMSAHWALQPRFPEISPHYRDSRPLWARYIVVTESILLMTAVIVGLSIIIKAVSVRSTKGVDRLGLVLLVIVWLEFLWVYK